MQKIVPKIFKNTEFNIYTSKSTKEEQAIFYSENHNCILKVYQHINIVITKR